VALAWLMVQPAVTAPIASATSVPQLAELVAAMDLRLTPQQIGRLDAVSSDAVPA
jgi:aryl-alcohol dehydrogenase-like predicted oxidoreductase